MNAKRRSHSTTKMTIEKDLAEIPSEGKTLKVEKEVIKEEEKETSAESPAEKKPEEEKKPPAEEEKETEIPFHKHPRFKEVIQARKEAEKKAEELEGELEKLREDVDSKFSEIKESHSETIPAWFSELYGDNAEAWNKYQEHDKETRDEIKQEIREEFESEQKKKTKEAEYWNNWIDGQITDLKDTGLKFEKNDLMKVMFDYKPTDDEGNLDFKKGYEIMEMLKRKDPEKSQARKVVVDEGGKSKSEPEAKEYFTPEDMRGKGWS